MLIISCTAVPDGKIAKREREMKNFDEYEKIKHTVSVILEELREDLTRLDALRKSLGPDGRNTESIRLQNENQKRIKKASALWNDMKKQLIKDQKRMFNKLKKEEIQNRKKEATLLGKELCELANRNSRVKSLGGPEEMTLSARREARAAQKREERRNQKRGRRGRGRRGKKGGGDDGEFDNIRSPTQQEQQFYDKVDANRAFENEMLDEISKGMDELKEIGQAMNTELKVQEVLLDDLGNKIDDTNAKFETANKRLNELLEESGGMSRWCPFLICTIILLALVGYIAKS